MTPRTSIDEHIRKPVTIGSIASNIEITYGSELATGRTIIIKGDIGPGTKITVYGWNLHVHGTIHEGVVIEYAQNFEKGTLLCVMGDIKNKVLIKNAHNLKVEGRIHDEVRITTNGKLVECNEVGKNSRVEGYNKSGSVLVNKADASAVIYSRGKRDVKEIVGERKSSDFTGGLFSWQGRKAVEETQAPGQSQSSRT